jgi:predicted nucleic acid-binding protein
VKPPAIVDAGPLVALINARDMHHAWTVGTLKTVCGPLLTCEGAVSEALFLLRNVKGGAGGIVSLLRNGGLRIGFSLAPEFAAVCALLTKYADVPMSLADACLVRMSELYPKHRVITLDTDFRVYRRHRHRGLPLLMPE